jgi:uncharacterized phage protein gp47/JayE
MGDSIEGVDSLPWYFNSAGIIDLYDDDTIDFRFKTVENRRLGGGLSYVLSESTLSPLIVGIITEAEVPVPTDRPTGVLIRRAKEEIKVLVPEASIIMRTNATFVGINFYVGLDAGGGTNGYQQMNDTYVNEVDATESVETSSILDQNTSTTSLLTVTTTTTRMTSVDYYTFTFNKTVITRMTQDGKIPNIFLSDGVTLDPSQTFYFVVTAIAYDESVSQAVESFFSIESEAKFLDYRTDYRTLPVRTRSDVMRTMGRRLITDNNLINIISGSVLNDTLNPVSFEFERFYVIEDFIFRVMSIDSLLTFDDANGDGNSDSLASSSNKQRLADALGITSENSLQQLINEQFDRWASNFNITRKSAVPATGYVTFYTEQIPAVDLLIPNGAIISTQADANNNVPAVNFSVIGSYIIESANAIHYYNAAKARYEIQADIRALTAGTIGNVPAGTITITNGLNPALRVVNDSPSNFGENIESNQKLAERIKLAFISFDSGTEGGYQATALAVPGIQQVRVEKAGDPLMMRDYDESTKKHIGGKVDIYLRGKRLLQVTDLLAFKYEYPQDVRGSKVSEIFNVVSASDFQLKSTNPKITENSPIVVVTKVRNNTRREDYDIDGLRIIGDMDTIVLPDSLENRTIGMATKDIVEVNYKYRSTNILNLTHKPVESIVSIVDSNGTTIPPTNNEQTNYELIKLDDPLKNGYSNIASDGVRFLFASPDDFEEFITVTNEQHQMLVNIPSDLNYKGVDIESISVYNTSDTSIIYIKDVDYSLTIGNEQTVTSLNLLVGSKIRHGNTIDVDYIASQNFTVTYLTNGLVQEVAEVVEPTKHACADVIVKEAVGNLIDLAFTVIRNPGMDKGRLKSRIQSAIAYRVRQMVMGESLTVSSVINIVRSVEGVKEVLLPFTRMMKRNDSFIPLDDIGYISFEIYHKISASGITSYRSIDSVLTYRTTENGGPSNLFRTVYEDRMALELVSDPSDVSKGYGRAYIQGEGKIIISTSDGALPQGKYYMAAYYINYGPDENLITDIETDEIEYLDVDSLSLNNIDIIDEKVVKRGL